MANGNRQPKWDIYEAAILLDGYLNTLQTNRPKLQIIKDISAALRKMAINRGMKIDEIFRNGNGISYQIKSMESAYKGRTVYIPSTKLFDEIVSIYRSNGLQYHQLLQEAKRMVNENSLNQTTIPGNSKKAPVRDKSLCFDTELISAAEKIIPAAFPNGLRKSSQIARKKFSSIFKELSGYDFPESIDLDEFALTVGIEYEDKIYAPSKETKKLICDEITNAKNKGHTLVFYEEFYNAFSQQLSSDSIFSAELFKKVLEHIMPNMFFFKSYACFSREDSLAKDIIHAYGNDTFLNYYEIKRRLPYADFYQIKVVCSRNEKFVSMGDEVYALADKIKISEKDVERAKRCIKNDIERNSFSMLNSINVDESENLNPGINSYALKTLLFDRYLSGTYSRRRSLITQAGVRIRMYDVMKDYCLEFEKISLWEIEAYEREISGNFAYGLRAAFDSMVRIDKTTFVHRDLITFDIDATDRALALYAKNCICPIADIPSFTSFPYVEGYSWNVFLLDSFCAYYSKKYRSIGGPARKGIIGAIYPTEMKISSYSDLLAQVASDSGLELTDNIISNYFSKHKYLLRKSNINEVLAKAQEIRLKEG